MENKQDKGFTLVELLIVIVILGILATVTVFAVRGITTRGEQSACDAEKKTLETAIETWYAESGTLKTDADADGHPTGQDLQDSQFIREYSDAKYTVVEGDTGLGTVSNVSATVGGPC